MALINCPECGREISSSAPSCPHCGAKISSLASDILLLVLGVFIALGIYVIFLAPFYFLGMW